MDTDELRKKYSDKEIGFCRVIQELCDRIDMLRTELVELRQKQTPEKNRIRRVA